MLGLQKSAYSDSAEIQFTLNLFVMNKSNWFRVRTDKTYLPERPSPGVIYGAGESMTRIGALLPEAADKWWRIRGGVDPAAVARDVLMDFENFGLTWLRQQMENHGCNV